MKIIFKPSSLNEIDFSLGDINVTCMFNSLFVQQLSPTGVVNFHTTAFLTFLYQKRIIMLVIQTCQDVFEFARLLADKNT